MNDQQEDAGKTVEVLLFRGALQKDHGENFTDAEADVFLDEFLVWVTSKGYGYGGTIAPIHSMEEYEQVSGESALATEKAKLAEVTRERDKFRGQRDDNRRMITHQGFQIEAAESRLAEAIAALEEIGAYPQDVPLFDEDARRLIGLAAAVLARLKDGAAG